jgi:hypothetical protein
MRADPSFFALVVNKKSAPQNMRMRMEGDYRRVTKSKRSLDVLNLLDKYRR